MKDLTVRQKFILKTLIEKGPLKMEDLSKLMDVSNRTISREISAINNYLKKYQASIVESNMYFKISGDTNTLKNIEDSLGAIPFQWLLTQEQRQVLMTIQLLLSDEPIKSAYFSYQFNVVEGTISLYLDKIEEWLKMRNLSLIRKRGYGLKIEGSELDKRKAIVELSYNYRPIDEVLSFLYNSEKDKYISAFFKLVFGNKLILLAKNILDKINAEVLKSKDDIGYFGMFLHLLLAIYRTKMDKPIKLNEDFVNDILSSNEFAFIKRIDSILKENDINLPDDELAYLAVHLNAKKYIYKQNGFKELGITLEDLSKELVQEVSRILNIKIKSDDQLILGLTQHFEPLLYRLSMGLQPRNPLIDDIKGYYGDLFKAVNTACKLIFSKYNIKIPKEEIGYITMHIGAAIERQQTLKKKIKVLVICPNGIGTARILSSKLKSAFPEINIIDIGSIRDYKNNEEYDLIISTIDISEMHNDNVIAVSPFLPNNDIEKIREFIDDFKVKNNDQKEIMLSHDNVNISVEKEKFDLVDNILRNLQYKYIDLNNIEELIDFVVNEIFDLHLTTDKDEIKDLIYKRESMGNVVIPGSHIALIHTRSDKMVMPFVGVYKLKNPITMKSAGFSYEDVDTFLVMLARRKESNDILEMLGKISITLIEDKDFNDILRFGDLKDIRNSLIKILNESQEELEDE